MNLTGIRAKHNSSPPPCGSSGKQNACFSCSWREMTRGRGRRKDILGRLGTIFIDSLTEGMISYDTAICFVLRYNEWESILSCILFSGSCFCFVSLILFSMLCFHCRFLFVCFFFRKYFAVSGFMLLFSGRVFLFRDVGFHFGLCISVSCFAFFF